MSKMIRRKFLLDSLSWHLKSKSEEGRVLLHVNNIGCLFSCTSVHLHRKVGSPTHYYDVLDLKPNATETEIKDAYIKLSKKFHPDLNKSPEASRKFQEINQAKEVLGNAEKRAEYNRDLGFSSPYPMHRNHGFDPYEPIRREDAEKKFYRGNFKHFDGNYESWAREQFKRSQRSKMSPEEQRRASNEAYQRMQRNTEETSWHHKNVRTENTDPFNFIRKEMEDSRRENEEAEEKMRERTKKLIYTIPFVFICAGLYTHFYGRDSVHRTPDIPVYSNWKKKS